MKTKLKLSGDPAYDQMLADEVKKVMAPKRVKRMTVSSTSALHDAMRHNKHVRNFVQFIFAECERHGHPVTEEGGYHLLIIRLIANRLNINACSLEWALWHIVAYPDVIRVIGGKRTRVPSYELGEQPCYVCDADVEVLENRNFEMPPTDGGMWKTNPFDDTRILLCKRCAKLSKKS